MEKYILLIILSAFVIYLFCRKKGLIEGLVPASRAGEDAVEEVVDTAALRGARASLGGGAEDVGEEIALMSIPENQADDLLRGPASPESPPPPSLGPASPAAEAEAAAARNAGLPSTGAADETSVYANLSDKQAGDDALLGESTEVKNSFQNSPTNVEDTKKLGTLQKDAETFTNGMADTAEGRVKLDQEGFRINEETGEILNKTTGFKIRTKQRRELYLKFQKDGEEFVARTSGVSRELEEKVESKLTRLREAGGNHPYIALGLGVIGVILFNRESEEDCVATCTSGEADDDWKKNHGVEDTYSENCPGDTCADFCSASGEGECSVRQRNEASVSEITTTILGAAGDGLDSVLGELWNLLTRIGAIPFAIVCCIFISIPVVMIIYSMITSKVSSVKQSVLNTGGIKGDVIRKGAEIYSGGGNLKKLNSPKVIILIVFFIFIVYNGRRK